MPQWTLQRRRMHRDLVADRGMDVEAQVLEIIRELREFDEALAIKEIAPPVHRAPQRAQGNAALDWSPRQSWSLGQANYIAAVLFLRLEPQFLTDYLD